MTTPILSLKLNLTREQALWRFRGAGLSRLLHTAATGPLRSVADVYIPFRLYRVHISDGARRETRLLALDAVRGNLDLYGFASAPEAGELVSVETRNRIAAELEEAQVRELLAERVRRSVFRQGFFRLRRLRIEAEPVGAEFHVPYWVGFSGRGSRASVAVMDAVRCRPEGAKLRNLLREWLAGPGMAGAVGERR